tara:strand:+ start:2004 stop:2591 length:588 start_codon:yes stop_codon:yes gene_type:complete
MQLEHKYWYYKNIFPKHLCNEIVSYALSKDLVKGSVVGNDKARNDKVRNSNIVWLDEKWLYIKLINIIRNANEQANWNFQVDNAEPVQFTVYKKGMHYDWHEDAFQKPYSKNNGSLCGKIRKISMSLILNDPKEYKGGEFEIDLGNRQKPTTTCYEIEEQGDCIVFPSDLLHKVRPVTHGVRYSLVMWTLGNPFK